MKKQVSKEVVFCDHCGAEGANYECMICGKNACYECQKKHFTRFTHRVHFQGSGDGEFCTSCVEANPDNELVVAYKAIMSLRDEESNWCDGFKKRCESAEKHLKEMQTK